MSKISEDLNLSKRYTNHCIRVTGVMNLTRANFTAKQVMSITGHKGVDSLAIYQRVQSDEKLSMGISLTYSLLHPEEAIMLRNNMELEGTSSTSQQNQDIPAIEPPPQTVNARLWFL